MKKKAGTHAKAVSNTILLALFGSMIFLTVVAQQSFYAGVSTGSVNYWPRVDITIDPDKLIGVNNLSLGFMLGSDWKSWHDSSILRGLARDANFKLVRLFSHSVEPSTYSLEPCTYWNESTNSGTFNWTNVDTVVQGIFEISAEPFFVLGRRAHQVINVIPSGMAVNPNTSLPYPDSWAAYCKEWVKHFREKGVPVRFYEIFNEPMSYFGWDNYTRLANFMAVFDAAAQAMRTENPNIIVSFDGTNRKPVLDYWLANGGADLDFISFHKYDAYTTGQHSDEVMLNRAESLQLETSPFAYYSIQDARQTYYDARFKRIPVINSESNFNSAYKTGTDPKIQQMIGATWTALVLRIGILKGLRYNIYFQFASSASWEQATKPSGGLGFGMINSDNCKPWYPYHVQRILGSNLEVGDTLVESISSSSETRVLSWLHDGKLKILLICKVDQSRAVYLRGVVGNLSVMRVDSTVPWETPGLQVDEMDATEPMICHGYTVALLSLSM